MDKDPHYFYFLDKGGGTQKQRKRERQKERKKEREKERERNLSKIGRRSKEVDVNTRKVAARPKGILACYATVAADTGERDRKQQELPRFRVKIPDRTHTLSLVATNYTSDIFQTKIATV